MELTLWLSPHGDEGLLRSLKVSIRKKENTYIKLIDEVRGQKENL